MLGDRKGPRFTIYSDDPDSNMVVYGQRPQPNEWLIIDNHSGTALGQLYCVMIDEQKARDLIRVLNDFKRLPIPLYKAKFL